MNHFFAILLPEEAREQLADFARRWERQIDPAFGAKWYPPDDYHVTLKFLGDISQSQVALAIEHGQSSALQRNTLSPGPITLAQKPFVAFPALVKPHVLWVEVVPNDRLSSLEFGLGLCLRREGVKPDFRPYKPHITLARCNPATGVPPFVLEERAFDDFMVDHFVLMQTTPPEARQNNPSVRYNTVHTFPLGDTHS